MESFAEEFEYILTQADTSIRRLSRLSGIPRRTLENWLYGRTERPRQVEPILQVAQTLNLPVQDTDRLLKAAGYPAVAQLQQSKNGVPAKLLRDWQLAPNILIGQKSGALPAQNNLPAATTPFIGRQSDREELAAILRRPDARLLTISGLGGSGKTRLALETARSLIDWFDHGVYFIPLDNVYDAQGFWQAILQGLHAPIEGPTSAQQVVQAYLRNKHILLVLDNFEHLGPLTSQIGGLLRVTQRVKLLVTSRQTLDLKAEHQFPIDGLSLTGGVQSPAYQLFWQTATRRAAAYDPSALEIEAILALCRAVQGLPLALELAATWIDVLKPAQILAHLQQDLREVWHGGADRPARQQSLWDLFDYSWQMLSGVEQEASKRLSILQGSFTAAAAMAIGQCNPATLKRLVQSSFLRRTTGSRLLMHPLVRQFLAEQAAQSGWQPADLEKQFLETTLRWAAAESQQLRETLKAGHFQTLHAEWQHIERAWQLALKYECYELLESCWDIIFYFEARGTWGQGNDFFEATRQQVPATNRRMQARIDEAQAFFAGRLYDLPRAIKFAKRSLTTLGDLGLKGDHDTAGIYARLVLFMAQFALNQKTFSAANKDRLREITAVYLGKFAAVAINLGDGVNRSNESDFNGAIAAYEAALETSGPESYTRPIIRCFLGIALIKEGRAAAAQEQFERALQDGLALDIYPAVVSATYELQSLAGKGSTSTAQCRETLEQLALEMGSRRTVGLVLMAAAVQYLNLGSFKRARQAMRLGVDLIWPEVDVAERARILAVAAQAFIAFGLIKNAPDLMALLSPKLIEMEPSLWRVTEP